MIDLFNGMMIGLAFGVIYLILMNWYNK